MVRLSLSTVAILASSSLVMAMPAPASNDNGAQAFSWENWVEGIIADPNGSHLSPEDAVEASKAAEAKRSLDIRDASCRGDDVAEKSAYVPDAVACIDQLASYGDKACKANSAVTVMCKIGGAQITAVVPGGRYPTSDTCQNMARAAGKIMDKCTRADQTVNGADYSFGNGNIAIQLSAPTDD
ncbi:hypothetical protein MRS44_014111 [Fusarium solani]|nr:hypothetical protein MRS44_014111 [Fusarium solani]KAJ4210669.1 hypothetical protein NW759_013210 [Fusarium solani]